MYFAICLGAHDFIVIAVAAYLKLKKHANVKNSWKKTSVKSSFNSLNLVLHTF